MNSIQKVIGSSQAIIFLKIKMNVLASVHWVAVIDCVSKCESFDIEYWIVNDKSFFI